MESKRERELIIIGAGPAGMTAAVYAARKQLDTLVITKDVGGQALWSSDIQNYLGFTFITGAELVKRFEEHVRSFGVAVEYSSVTKVSSVDDSFEVVTEDNRRFLARALIVSSGKSPRTLNVPGEKEFLGRGVAYCATCDAPLFAGKNVAVVGGGNSGLDAAVQLMRICPHVYIIEVADQLRGDEAIQNTVLRADNVTVLTGTTVKEIRGDSFVRSVVVQDVHTNNIRELDVEGVFVEIGLSPNSDFVKDVVKLNKWREIPVDCGARTGVPGLFAAGDVTDVPQKQIICAAGDGAKAALGAYSYLVRRPVPTDWLKSQ
ncbi:MAG: FAD-dependent oxidoreductase [Armatimonadota bacterium]|nr:FAD-dependent oxidoreductase [Armatimonadota bacterium]